MSFKAILIATLLGVISCSAWSSVQIEAEQGVCRLTEEQWEGADKTYRMASGPCVFFEQKGFIVMTEEGYQLSTLSEAMGTRFWPSIAEAQPKPIPRKPDYIVRLTTKDGVMSASLFGHEAQWLKSKIVYPYIDTCLTRADLEEIKRRSLTNESIDEARDAAKRRPAHTPGKHDQIAVETVYWVYEMNVGLASQQDDGGLTLNLMGTAAGPSNWDAKVAGLCNGYKPEFKSETFSVPVTVHDHKGSVTLPIIGRIEVELTPPEPKPVKD